MRDFCMIRVSFVLQNRYQRKIVAQHTKFAIDENERNIVIVRQL